MGLRVDGCQIPGGAPGWSGRQEQPRPFLCFLQPLLDLERNGANLHYSVWWRRKDTSEGWNNVTTAATKHVVHGTETYVPYEIKIQARNEFGSGPESNVVIGFSGEDSKQMHRSRGLGVSFLSEGLIFLVFPCSAPTDAPADLRVSKVDSTKAHIHWTPVDLTSVQGEFKEYRVSRGGDLYPAVSLGSCFLTPSAVSSSQLYYWRDASLVPGLEVNREKRTKGFYSTVSEPTGLLSELLPFSRYKMFMVVANTHYEGPPSNTAEFTTKEGGEDQPSATPTPPAR